MRVNDGCDNWAEIRGNTLVVGMTGATGSVSWVQADGAVGATEDEDTIAVFHLSPYTRGALLLLIDNADI